MIRDTLMAIGKAFKGTVKNVAKTAAEKEGQKVGELAVEKGSKQIRKLLQERKQKPVSQDAKTKLANILQNRVLKKIRWRPSEIKSNFGKRNLIAEIFSLNINDCSHVQNSTIPREDYIRPSEFGHPVHLPWK